MNIPKNFVFIADVKELHYNPKYWPGVDPKKFYPERLKLIYLLIIINII